MITEHQKMFEGNALGEAGDVAMMFAPKSGTIKSIGIVIDDTREGGLPPVSDVYFNLRINDGAPLFSGSNRPVIASGEISGTLENLNIPVARFDRLVFSIENIPVGGVATPIGFEITIDDGVAAGGGGAVGNPAKIDDCVNLTKVFSSLNVSPGFMGNLGDNVGFSAAEGFAKTDEANPANVVYYNPNGFYSLFYTYYLHSIGDASQYPTIEVSNDNINYVAWTMLNPQGVGLNGGWTRTALFAIGFGKASKYVKIKFNNTNGYNWNWVVRQIRLESY